MPDKKKHEPTDEEIAAEVSFGEGTEPVLGFVQEPDGHGWSDEELAAREAARAKELETAAAQGIEVDEVPEQKPAKRAVAMDTGTKASS